MSDTTIENRLRDTSSACIDAYVAWESNRKDAAASKELHSTVHELRKVASRLEIELAVSERDNSGQKPLRPPMHKTSKAGVMSDNGGAKVEKTRARRPRKPKEDSVS